MSSNLTPREILDTMLGYLGFVFEIEEQERDGHKVLQIFTHEADRLIGRREQTLDDLQFLLNRILQSGNPKAARVVVDVDHHRAMRDDALIAKVRHLAESVKSTGRPPLQSCLFSSAIRSTTAARLGTSFSAFLSMVSTS